GLFSQLGTKKDLADQQGGDKGKGDPKGESPARESGPGKVPDVAQKPEGGQKAEPPAPPAVAPPAAPRKIIIRSGELEFEITSFDDSVSTIMRLVTATKGGFVATVNSDKLPNGKVRGSVVIRIPPEQLDKFVLDLRKEFVKTGELKN